MTIKEPTTRTRGRRSLNGGGDSPQLRLRLPDALREALASHADRRGVTLSEHARRVLADSVDDAGSRSGRREERVQLELHKTLLAVLLTEFDTARTAARRNLELMRRRLRGAQAQGWLDEWAELIERPGPGLIEAFVSRDEHSVDLRQVSPFAGVLSDEQRLAAIERAGRAPR